MTLLVYAAFTIIALGVSAHPGSALFGFLCAVVAGIVLAAERADVRDAAAGRGVAPDEGEC